MMRVTYNDVIQLASFQDRFELLKKVAMSSVRDWGSRRAYNRRFYHSREWKQVRDAVIVRDKGCNLAHPDYLLPSDPIIHHIVPIEVEDMLNGDPRILFDMDNLILTNQTVHNAIHYGQNECPYSQDIVRRPNDTCPWR